MLFIPTEAKHQDVTSSAITETRPEHTSDTDRTAQIMAAVLLPFLVVAIVLILAIGLYLLNQRTQKKVPSMIAHRET